MKYSQLKTLDRLEAIKMVLPPEMDVSDNVADAFPFFPEVIVFGGNFWKSNDLIADFINEYIEPKTEKDISVFLQEIAYRIASDRMLSDSECRKKIAVDYQLLYKQHCSLYKSPDALGDWAEAKGVFIWFEYVLAARRLKQFQNVLKPYSDEDLFKISRRIKAVYNFSEREIIYLQYFCSQAKLEELDPSLNTFLYLWSDEQFTGKTTVGSYICSFLNGETTRNVDPHKSKLKIEMQFDKFAIPKGVTSRCVFIDEGGFFDMKKTYNDFKDTITSNSCELEYKFKNSRRVKRCYRNYLFTSNNDPIYFVQADSERRILPVHFTKPENVSFDELQKMWYEFVLECNLAIPKMTELYHTIVQPNSQAGETQNIILELKDILTKEKVMGIGSNSYFSVSNVMMLPEISSQKTAIDRKLVKEVLIQMYGKPDACQRFYKMNRVAMDGDVKDETLPF